MKAMRLVEAVARALGIRERYLRLEVQYPGSLSCTRDFTWKLQSDLVIEANVPP